MNSQLVPAACIDGAGEPSGPHASVPSITTNAHRQKPFTGWIVTMSHEAAVSFP